MDVREEIEALVEFDGRGPGTDAERRAAGHLEQRLRDLGREADTEPVTVWPNWALTYALHASMAIVGSVVSVTVPVIGAVLVLLAVILTFLDASGMFVSTRRLLGRRSSQNVVSSEDGDKGGDLVLVAHYDAGRGGLVFNRSLQERRATLGKLIRRPIGPFQPFLWTLVAVMVCTLLRLPGIDSVILTVIQFIFTVLLILAVPVLLDTALAATTPGANDNASGAATVMRLAERFGGKLEHFDVHVLLTGSQEALGLGMRSFLKRRKGELDKERAVFINLDEVGAGTVRYTTTEGLFPSVKSHKQLVDLCEEIVEDATEEEKDDGEDGEDGEGENRFGARGVVSRTASDGYAARSAGFPAITISCRNAVDYVPTHHQPGDTPDRIDDEALERAFGFCSELIERLDATVGPDLDRPVPATLLNEEES